MAVDIRRGTDRFTERHDGRLTQHGFSFGSVYDPDHVRFGPMVCHDDHLLRNGVGFEEHQHGDLVIVTWVVSGAVEHTGPTGSVIVPASSGAVFRTGASAVHAEVAAAPQTRFVQVWLADPAPPPVASYSLLPDPTDAVEVLPGATFSVLHLGDGETARLPAGPRVHAFVARGALLRSSLAEPLREGDAFLFTDEPSHEVTAGVPTELLVWELANA